MVPNFSFVNFLHCCLPPDGSLSCLILKMSVPESHTQVPPPPLFPPDWHLVSNMLMFEAKHQLIDGQGVFVGLSKIMRCPLALY